MLVKAAVLPNPDLATGETPPAERQAESRALVMIQRDLRANRLIDRAAANEAQKRTLELECQRHRAVSKLLFVDIEFIHIAQQ
jgi:hypothetical protein